MLPKLLFVAEQKEDDGSVWFQAERLALNAIQDDGPTVVGTYQLVGTRTLKKNPLPLVVPRKRRRALEARG